MFIERINHVTGEREWVVAEEDYDMAQELARSRFADMILDFDRNDKFLAGLQTCIAEKKAKGERAHVLDIGTGTGLLSLMAAREGAERVTSLEVFQPMAECARKITQASPWKDKITVVSTRSTDLSHLGGEKPNIIVAEVFDTELNGEGALRTFKEALTNLVQPGCRVIPSLGRVWVVPVSSQFLKKFNRVPTLNRRTSEDGSGDDAASPSSSPLGDCPGTSAVFDCQLSRVSPDNFTRLAEPILAFEFDFESADSIVYDETFSRSGVAVESGDVDAVMMWWDLDMDRTGKNWIDMAPSWANDQYAWRDHWMQAVYYLPSRVHLKKGQLFQMHCSHDEFSMWFDLGSLQTGDVVPRPYCHCGLHSLLARQSVYRLNDVMQNEKLAKEIDKLCRDKSVVVLGEGSLLALLAAQVARITVVVEPNTHFRSILIRYAKHYQLDGRLSIVAGLDDVIEKPEVIISEPFYLSAMNPWQNLRFWHEANNLRERFGKDVEMWPKSGVLYGLPEHFSHLHTIASPVGTVSGFDLSYFDSISQKAREATDAVVDEQPLWEYGGVATSSERIEVMRFDLAESPRDNQSDIKIRVPANTNGIPLWMEWQFGEMKLSSGLLVEAEMGSEPQWNIGFKQGVFLLPPPLMGKQLVKLQTNYYAENGDIVFKFS